MSCNEDLCLHLREVPCNVSLPISAYTAGEVSSIQCLQTRICALSLPSLWIDAFDDSSAPHLSLCKLVRCQSTAQVEVTYTLTIDESFEWCLSLFSHRLDPTSYASLSHTPLSLRAVDQVFQLLATLDSMKICIGNPEQKFVDLATRRGLLPSRESSGMTYYVHVYIPALLDTILLCFLSTVYIDKTSGTTVRSLSCELLFESDHTRCLGCVKSRATLLRQLKRESSTSLADRSLPSSHTNLSLLSPSQVTKLQLTHQQIHLSSKQLN